MTSKFTTATIPSTAGNVATQLVAPAEGHKIRLWGWRVMLSTDATVANRNFKLAVGSNDMSSVQGAPVAAAQVQIKWTGGVWSPSATGSFAEPDAVLMQCPVEWTYGITATLSVVNGVAGDSYSGYYYYEDQGPT